MTTTTVAARARRSTIALKLGMAATGVVFIGYVLLHMYGNLKAFAGQNAYDTYSHHLRTIGEPILPYGGLLWIIRVVLIASLLVHAATAYTLWARANKARGVKYSVKKSTTSTLSSRTMRWGGTTILLFLVFHLLHYTFRVITPGSDSDSVYQRLVAGFEPSYWYITVIYLLALGALGMHLRHGTFSAAQTLGLTSTPARAQAWRTTGLVLAVVIAGGFALVPLSVTVGIIS